MRVMKKEVSREGMAMRARHRTKVSLFEKGAIGMRQRWLLLIGLTTALVLVAAVGVRATLDQYRDRPLDRQNLGLIRTSTTDYTRWTVVPGWGFSDGAGINARGGLAATLSVTVSGAPVRFRIAIEDVERDFRIIYMKPASVVFDPGAGTGSFSSTFVKDLSRGPYTVNIEWRSPTGAPVTLVAGSVVLQYGSAT
jgi:hypothetical protein